jgi:hypothetical protein
MILESAAHLFHATMAHPLSMAPGDRVMDLVNPAPLLSGTELQPVGNSAAQAWASKNVSISPKNIRAAHNQPAADSLTGVIDCAANGVLGASSLMARTSLAPIGGGAIPFYDELFWATWDQTKTPNREGLGDGSNNLIEASTIKEGQKITIDINRDVVAVNVQDGNVWTSEEVWRNYEIWKTLPTLDKFMQESPPSRAGMTEVSISLSGSRVPYASNTIDPALSAFLNGASPEDLQATTGNITAVGASLLSNVTNKPGRIRIEALKDDILEGDEYFFLKVRTSSLATTEGFDYYTFVIEDQSPGSPAALFKGTNLIAQLGLDAAAQLASDFWEAVKEDGLSKAVFDHFFPRKSMISTDDRNRLRKNTRTQITGARG